MSENYCDCGCIYLEAECPNCNRQDQQHRIAELEANLAVAYATGRVDGIQEAAIVARQALIDGAYIKRGSHQERPSSVMFLAETLVSNAIGSLIPAIAEIKGKQL